MTTAGGSGVLDQLAVVAEALVEAADQVAGAEHEVGQPVLLVRWPGDSPLASESISQTVALLQLPDLLSTRRLATSSRAVGHT